MALADVRLSLLTFPQNWAANALDARVLLLPAGDPRVPAGLGSGLPVFAGTAWPLRVTILPNPDSLLSPAPGGTPGAVSFTFTATPPNGAVALFDALDALLKPVPPDPLVKRRSNIAAAQIRKHLPESYTRSFPFERPAEGTTIGDEFGCALRDVTPATETDPKPPLTITWGAVLSFALRQPAVARALGLIYDIPFPVGIPDPLTAGGWIYVGLDPAGPVQPMPQTAVRSYAARLPVLAKDAVRRLFAAVLLPVGAMTVDYDEALAEAGIYGDGFAKIVHAAQAITADAASSGHNKLPPGTDAGIDLGWDDEQVTKWMNRQLEAMKVRLGVPMATNPLEAPLGVAGYRIDVRLPDRPGFDNWQSLCRAISVDENGNPAPLVFPPAPAAPVFSETFDDELTVEPASARSMLAPNQTAWLPQYFTRWQGGSLVANDLTLFKLSGTAPGDAKGVPIDVPPATYAAPLPAVPLRYGTRYEFRCRLADLTGGGPAATDEPDPAVPPRIAKPRFLRHVPPKSVRLETDIARPAPFAPTPEVAAVTSINVWRPLIGYPELVFAGIDEPAVVAGLLAGAAAARAARDAVGANDPDVTHLRVTVQVKATAHDPGPALPVERDGDFRTLYTVSIPFPPFDPGNVLDRGVAIPITLSYQDVADISTVVAPAPGTTDLPVPRARNVRLRLRPFCADKPDYFATPSVQHGLTADVSTRAEAQGEDPLFVLRPRERELNGILLQPAPDMVNRLAAHLDVAANGLTLTARPGERVVFAASSALKHSVTAIAER